MARQNGFHYEISWEKDESDANLEYEKLTSYVPGVTHLGKKNQKPSKMKPQKSTQSSSKHPKGQMMTTKVGHDVKGQEVSKGEDTVSLKNLRPQDKKRIANLIKELAKVGEQKEVAMQQLTVERKEFEVKYINLQTQMNSLKKERESLQHQYLQCQKLLLECQKRLGKEQARHQQVYGMSDLEHFGEDFSPKLKTHDVLDSADRQLLKLVVAIEDKYLKSGQGHAKEPMNNRSLSGESKLQNQYFELDVHNRADRQFQPQMQSTLRVLRGPEYFAHPMDNQHLPPNQQAAIHQTMNHHEMSLNNYPQPGHQTHSDRFSSVGTRDQHQGNSRVTQHSQGPVSKTGKISSKERDANPLSPSIFSPDEFHPLPEELINSRSFEAIEAGRFRHSSAPKGDYEPERLPTQTSQSYLRGINEEHRISDGVQGEEHPIPVGKSRRKGDYVQEETEISPHRHQREHLSSFNSANQQRPQYETENSEQVGRGRESQNSGNSFHSENREDILQRNGPVSEMMIQRQRQLEEQKMLLKREQDWLQKQLQDQEQLLYQKQMELEAHRESLLLEEEHFRSGPNRVATGVSKGQVRTFHDNSHRRQDVSIDRHREKYNTMAIGPDVGNSAMKGDRIPHHPLSGGDPGPNSHRKDFQGHGEKGDVTLSRGGSRDHNLIHGSVSLHEDSQHQRHPPAAPSDTTVDASTSPLLPPQRQIEKRSIGLSPAIHHPHSRLLEGSSAGSSPVRSPDQFPIISDHTVQAIPVKDSHFLDDIIEELNSLPSDSSNETIIQPVKTFHDSNRSGLTSFHKTQHKKSTLYTSYSNRVYGSEIVSSTDEEDESQLLDDIFFLN